MDHLRPTTHSRLSSPPLIHIYRHYYIIKMLQNNHHRDQQQQPQQQPECLQTGSLLFCVWSRGECLPL